MLGAVGTGWGPRTWQRPLPSQVLLCPDPNQKHREDVEKEELATEEHIGAEAELRGDGSIRWAAGRRSIGSSRRHMCEDSRTPQGRTGYLFFINIVS